MGLGQAVLLAPAESRVSMVSFGFQGVAHKKGRCLLRLLALNQAPERNKRTDRPKLVTRITSGHERHMIHR